MNQISTKSLAIVCLTLAAASAAPIIETSGISFTGLDTEWQARARNFRNRAGTWKPIIFGDGGSTNNSFAVSSNSAWSVTGNTITGIFSLEYAQLGTSPGGSVRFKTGNHDITNKNVGTDSGPGDSDGPITNLFIDVVDNAQVVFSLTNLTLKYGKQTVLLPNLVTGSGATVDSKQLMVGNLLPEFGKGFTLSGDYRMVSSVAVSNLSDESPRIDFKALSGGVIDNPVPEPATWALIGGSLVGLGVYRKRQRRRD